MECLKVLYKVDCHLRHQDENISHFRVDFGVFYFRARNCRKIVLFTVKSKTFHDVFWFKSWFKLFVLLLFLSWLWHKQYEGPTGWEISSAFCNVPKVVKLCMKINVLILKNNPALPRFVLPVVASWMLTFWNATGNCAQASKWLHRTTCRILMSSLPVLYITS